MVSWLGRAGSVATIVSLLRIDILFPVIAAASAPAVVTDGMIELAGTRSVVVLCCTMVVAGSMV